MTHGEPTGPAEPAEPAATGRGEFGGLAALVTGGASGIGLATARLLAGRGARVAVIDRADLPVQGGGVRALALDFRYLSDALTPGEAREMLEPDVRLRLAGVHAGG